MTPLARIPFSPKAERMISQMARWMTFVGGLHVLGGLLELGFSVLAVGACVYGMTMVDQIAERAEVTIPLWLFGVGVGISFLYGLFGVVVLAEGGLLIKARVSFEAVADSDVADQANLSAAFRSLKFFFSLEVALGALSVLGSLFQIGLAFASRSLAPLLESLQNGVGS